MKTKVKICGITSVEDALFAAEAGADFLGYIFYPPSKRFIAPRNAANIARMVREKFPAVQHVGVFVDDEVANVAWLRNLVGLDFVQLHGRETPDYCAELDAVGARVIKTVGIGEVGASVDPASYGNIDYFLCDTHDDHAKGGTGRRFDLSAMPSGISMDRLFLAGGLDPENIADLLATVRPFAVDVSTGVEISPGLKSHVRVKAFIDNVRSVTVGDSISNEEASASNVS